MPAPPDSTLATPSAAQPPGWRGRHGSGQRRAWRVRWSAVAAGSTVGIALWATLYVWGAAIMCLTSLAPGDAWGARVGWGLYAGTTAGAALWAASVVASRAAGAACRGAGVLHGLVLWGMANITLVGAVGLLGLGVAAPLRGPLAYVVHVGALAVSGGADIVGQDTAHWPVGASLVGMGLVMVTSLALSVWGGIWGSEASRRGTMTPHHNVDGST